MFFPLLNACVILQCLTQIDAYKDDLMHADGERAAESACAQQLLQVCRGRHRGGISGTRPPGRVAFTLSVVSIRDFLFLHVLYTWQACIVGCAVTRALRARS